MLSATIFVLQGGPQDQLRRTQPGRGDPFAEVRVAGGDLVSPRLQQRLDVWVREWEQFHLCPVRDDAHEARVGEGRALYDLAADEFRAAGVRLLADFEGSDEQQSERRRAWHERWGSPQDGD
jgi:hypothetical protein